MSRSIPACVGRPERFVLHLGAEADPEAAKSRAGQLSAADHFVLNNQSPPILPRYSLSFFSTEFDRFSFSDHPTGVVPQDPVRGLAHFAP